MKKVTLFCCLTGVVLCSLRAQLADRLLPHMGFMYEIVDLTKGERGGVPIREQDSTIGLAFYTFSLGTYAVLAHKNDVVSLGVDASIQGGFNFESISNNTGMRFLIQAPVFLMGRYGINSTVFNDQGFGLGAGLGADYVFLKRDLYNRKLSSLIPAAVFEIGFRSGGGTMTIRGHIPLSTPRRIYEFSGVSQEDHEYTYKNWGIGLIYSL